MQLKLRHKLLLMVFQEVMLGIVRPSTPIPANLAQSRKSQLMHDETIGIIGIFSGVRTSSTKLLGVRSHDFRTVI